MKRNRRSVIIGLISLIVANNTIVADEIHSHQVETGILGPIADGTPSLPARETELPDFDIKSTVVRRIEVVEPPPMAGLPPITGTITQTVHLVEDPGLADPPPPVPAPAPDDPAVLARMRELRQDHRNAQMVFVSATVYDRSRTFLQWYLPGGLAKQMSAWSNLDFNYFTGFASYQVKAADGEVHEISIMMGIGDVDTRKLSETYTRLGKTYQVPEHPDLPALATSGPAFAITEGDTSDLKLTEVMGGLHDLYRTEGPRMVAAYDARVKAEEERRAYLLAHPPKPKDVTVYFWNRNHPIGETPNPPTEGSAP